MSWANLSCVVASLSRVWLFVIPWTEAHLTSLSLSVSQSFLKFMSTDSVMPSNHLLLPSIFPSIRVFSSESASTSGGQSIGASASASVLPMNIQGWFPLGWTGLISCCSSDSQESPLAPQFSSTYFLVLNLLYGPALASVHYCWMWELT